MDLGDGGRGTVVAMFSESESPVVSVQYEDQVGSAPPMCIDRQTDRGNISIDRQR